jgi:hypothetical protein
LTGQKANKVFISHSGNDQQFATLVAERLRTADMDTWIDTERILVGDDILAQIAGGLATMDLLILIVSQAALQSEWVRRELAYATTREVSKTETLILPFIIDRTAFTDLPWQIAARHARRVTPDAPGAAAVAEAVKEVLARRLEPRATPASPASFTPDPEVDRLIQDVRLGDWPSAERAALAIVRETDPNGRNAVFERLLDYQDTGNEDLLWQALPTIESVARLAPSLVSRRQLSRLASNRDFSVRATAASICHDWAVDFPHLVPMDILLKLAVPNEDWYVEAPAIAALKTLIRAIPPVLQVFFSGLRSGNPDERIRAAQALAEIAEQEPELLDADELKKHSKRLNRFGDRDAAKYLREAFQRVKSAKAITRYKYGI